MSPQFRDSFITALICYVIGIFLGWHNFHGFWHIILEFTSFMIGWFSFYYLIGWYRQRKEAK